MMARDVEVIDSELRLIAAVRMACRAARWPAPNTAVADELLDERACAEREDPPATL